MKLCQKQADAAVETIIQNQSAELEHNLIQRQASEWTHESGLSNSLGSLYETKNIAVIIFLVVRSKVK